MGLLSWWLISIEYGTQDKHNKVIQFHAPVNLKRSREPVERLSRWAYQLPGVGVMQHVIGEDTIFW